MEIYEEDDIHGWSPIGSGCTKFRYLFSVPIVFYVSNAYAMICFMKLAISWPKLMEAWENVERNLAMLTKPVANKGKLAYKIRIISIIVLLTSLCNQRH